MSHPTRSSDSLRSGLRGPDTGQGSDPAYQGPPIITGENGEDVQVPDYTENGISTWVTLTDKA
jgi:hypothetical protein